MNNKILAIDPSLSSTGAVIIRRAINKNRCELEEVNRITTSSKNTTDERIKQIIDELYYFAVENDVDTIVLEDGFSGRNLKTGLQLATLRGAIMGTFLRPGWPVIHMLPTQIRLLFGLKGNATKEEVAKQVINIFGEDNQIIQAIGPYSDKQNKNKTSDIYDAISIGVAYIHSLQP